MTQNELNFINEALGMKCQKLLEDIVEADTFMKAEKAKKESKKSKKEGE